MDYIEKALDLWTRLTRPTHPNVIWCIIVRGDILSDMGRLDEAETIAREVLSLREATLGPSHIDTIESLAECAYKSQSIKKYADSEDYALEYLHRSSQHSELKENFAKTLEVLTRMGCVQEQQNKYDEAKTSYQQAHSTAMEAFGKDHEETWFCRINLDLLLLSKGSVEEAQQVLDPIFLKARMNGLTNDSLLDSTFALAGELERLKRWAEAEVLFHAVVHGYKVSETRGPQDLSTIKATNKLIFTYHEQQKLADFTAMLRDEHKYRSETRGPEEFHTLLVFWAMIQALEEKLSSQEAKDVQLSSQISLSTSELKIERQNAQDSVAKALYNEGQYKFGERIAIET